MKVVLRDYTCSIDFEEVFSFTKEIIGLSPYEEAREELKFYPKHNLCSKVALNNNNIIGFISTTYPYWNSIAIIDFLVVKQKYRNQKIGTKLIKITEDELRNAGIRIITVQTATGNEDGIRFYKKFGYNERGVFPAYFGKNNDLIWFDKYLI